MKYSACLLVALIGVALAYPTTERRHHPAKNGDDLIRSLKDVLNEIESDKEYDDSEYRRPKRPPPYDGEDGSGKRKRPLLSDGEEGSGEGRRGPRPERDQQEAQANRDVSKHQRGIRRQGKLSYF